MKIKLLRQVEHNNKTYKINETVDFDEKDAKALTSRGFAVEVKEPKKEVPVVTESKQTEEAKKAEEVTETVPKAKAEAKKATKPATPKKTTAKATKALTAKKEAAKKAN